MSTRVFRNPHTSAILDGPFPDRGPLEFHRRLPGYRPTPLVGAAELARALRVGRVWVKDESDRLGMPAFKILGASWAVYRGLEERQGDERFGNWETIYDLRAKLA